MQAEVIDLEAYRPRLQARPTRPDRVRPDYPAMAADAQHNAAHASIVAAQAIGDAVLCGWVAAWTMGLAILALGPWVGR